MTYVAHSVITLLLMQGAVERLLTDLFYPPGMSGERTLCILFGGTRPMSKNVGGRIFRDDEEVISFGEHPV